MFASEATSVLRHIIRYPVVLYVLLLIGWTVYCTIQVTRWSIRLWRVQRAYPDWPRIPAWRAARRKYLRRGLVGLVLAAVVGGLAWPYVHDYQPIPGHRPVRAGTLDVRRTGATWRVAFRSEIWSLRDLHTSVQGRRWFIVGAMIQCPFPLRYILLPNMHRPIWIGVQTPQRSFWLPQQIRQQCAPFLGISFRIFEKIPVCRATLQATPPMEFRSGRYTLFALPGAYMVVSEGK